MYILDLDNFFEILYFSTKCLPQNLRERGVEPYMVFIGNLKFHHDGWIWA